MAQPVPNQVKKVEDTLSPLIAEAKEQGKAALAAVSDVTDGVTEKLKEIPKIIKKYPMEAVLIGFGAGILGAFLYKKLAD